MKNRGSRFWFTMLGMAVAIGVIVFLVSFGFGLQNVLFEQITTEESLLTLDVVSSDGEALPITSEIVEEIGNIEGVEKVSPQLTVSSIMKMGEVTTQASLRGVDPEFFTLAGLSPEYGKFFTQTDKKEIVINEAVVNLFYETPENILGEKLSLTFFLSSEEETSGERKTVNMEGLYEIVGIVTETERSGRVYVPRYLMEEANGFQDYQSAKVKVENEKYLEGVREQLISKGFLVSTLSEIIEEANRIFRIVQIILGVFGFFALLVAAIGLINTMTITLLERTNEIGIMRAIGAPPKTIRRMFLAESVITGFIGGLVGIILGIFFSESFNLILNLLARALGGQPVSVFVYPGWFLIFTLILSTLVGMIAGIWPAKRAASLNPLEALRYK